MGSIRSVTGQLTKITDAPNNPPSTSRARQTKRGVEKADELQQAATELFLARGFDGVSVEEIVRAAGGSKTNVYNFFGNKERLFVIVVDELCQEFLAPLAALNVTGCPLREGLRKFGRKLLSVLLSERHLSFHRLIMAESGRLPEIGEIWRRRGPGRTQSMIDALIARHADPKRLSPHDTLRFARLFHDMITGSALANALTSAGDRMPASELDKTIVQAAELVACAIEDANSR